jgi:3-deoxy-D-arabino-heptulosonate 7-phosphate (DAHP) synthase class II
MKRNGKESRSALLIRCTEEEANAIREAAKQQRRTVSAFVIRALMNRVSVQRVAGTVQKPRSDSQARRTPPRGLHN